MNPLWLALRSLEPPLLPGFSVQSGEDDSNASPGAEQTKRIAFAATPGDIPQRRRFRRSSVQGRAVTVGRLAEIRREIAGSPRAALLYFVLVLGGLALAATWSNANAVAYAGIFLYVLPVPFTWPLMDAAFTRYSRDPVVSAPARSRLHWVICVLVGVLVSIVIGALGGS